MVLKFPSLPVVHVSVIHATYGNCGGFFAIFFFNIGKLHISYTTKIILLNFEKIQALENAKIMALIYFIKSFKYTVTLAFYGTLSQS